MPKKDISSILGAHDPTLANRLAEGTVTNTELEVRQGTRDPAPGFMRVVVLDVVSDPTIIDSNKIEYWTHVLGVTNIQYARLLPRNTIIGQSVSTGRTIKESPRFLFPFFSSHLSLPCKPGEVVWAMFEDANAYIKNLGFWFCRIAEPHIADDINHTHTAAKLDLNLEATLEERFDGKNKDFQHQMHNGAVKIRKDGQKEVIVGSAIFDPPSEFNGVDAFEKLITETDASKLMNYEPVPRFKKRPGDVALEGSNNTLIVLGTDRSGSIGNFKESTTEKGVVPIDGGALSGNAGAIDLVAGRGTFAATGGSVVSTTRLISTTNQKIELKKEIDKLPQNTVANEGDPDFKNDRSRLLISQRTSVDKNFGLEEHNSQFKISDSPTGDAAITIKSDKVRIVARSDISFIVTNFDSSAPVSGSTQSYKTDNNNLSNWASITIKTNGDIVFTPSEAGVVKLGGEDADKAILCTSIPADVRFGITDALPVASSGGGFVGTAGGKVDIEAVSGQKKPDMGTFASKVLVKSIITMER